MDIGSILLILALLVFVAAFVLRPLQEDRAQTVSLREHRLSALMAERERLLDALLELDADHELGKVPEEIYSSQRDELVKQGAEVLRQIDQELVQAGEETGPGEPPAGRKPAASKVKYDDDELEEMIVAHKRARDSRWKESERYCRHCGGRLLANDRFCPQCGKAQS